MEDKGNTDYCISSVSSQILEAYSTYYNQVDQSKMLWSLLLERIITVLGPYKGSIGSYFDLKLYFYSGFRNVIAWLITLIVLRTTASLLLPFTLAFSLMTYSL